ncbi:MAG: M20/M25/M40 family metallo-hydrolase, partial [Phycisphaerales bacterium JB063]
LEVTGLPTAAGLEGRVVAWVRAWAEQHKRKVSLRADRYGNLVIRRVGVTSTTPIFFTAHLDHPAFAVTKVMDEGKAVQAEFRGGVHDEYFEGTRVAVYPEDAGRVTGKIVSLDRKRSAKDEQLVTARFARKTSVKPGDLMTWALPKPTVTKGTKATGRMLRCPACDDLAAVAAAVSAYERLLDKPRGVGDVRLLFTRAEEVGFVGAIGATKSGILPKRSTLICLENSKSFAESPIGGGPIIRVGDKMSTFDPELNVKIESLAQQLAKQSKSFNYQRKLMPGGTCEATAFRALGYLSTCLCLPLGNYHNMDESKRRIAPETIALNDYHHLIGLLETIGRNLHATDSGGDLVRRLDALFERRRALLD